MKDRRTQIIDAAMAIMCRQGYAQTSVDEVIREAGLCGKGHFYHHFKSKEELGYAVLERQFQQFAEHGLAVLRDPRVAPFDRLDRFIDLLVEGQMEEGSAGCPFGNLSAELSERHEGFRRELATVFERWAGQIEALLYEARAELEAGTDPQRMAVFVIATLEGAMLMSRVQRRTEVLRGIAEQLKDYVRSRRREMAPTTASLA